MAAPTLVMLSDRDGYVPEASREIIAFARNESRWPINRYVQYVPSTKQIGLFVQLGRDEFVKDTGRDLKAWKSGDATPDGENNQVPFLLQEYRCENHIEAWRLGYDVIDQTSLFSPRLVYTRAAVTKVLTDRTNYIAGILTTSANWGTHTATANALNGGLGTWDKASDDPNSPYYEAIKVTLQAAGRQIVLDTNGAVEFKDLHCVIGPDLALKASRSPEMVNYCRESPAAKNLMEKGFDPQYERWGMPSSYAGFNFVVEDSPIVTGNVATGGLAAGGGYPSQPAMAPESAARTFIWPTGTAVLCSRQGGLDGELGGISYSTFQVFHYKGLLQQYAFDEPWNFRVRGMVKECIDCRIVANLSGYCITNCI